MRSIVSLTLLSLVACGAAQDQLTVDEELLLTAVSGEEEELARDAMFQGGLKMAVDQPELFRVCATEDTHKGLLSIYDDNADGLIDPEEEAGVWDARATRDDCETLRRARIWAGLTLIYDDDGSTALESAEIQSLFSDFTLRCENRHAMLVDAFDGDGDGEVSEDEIADIHAEIDAHRAEREGMCPSDHERPEGKHGRGGLFKAPHERMSPMLMTWDTDQDGSLSDIEREAAKQAIRDGEMMVDHSLMMSLHERG
jgi:Ca2+-binding EF-hand superfamily protein